MSFVHVLAAQTQPQNALCLFLHWEKCQQRKGREAVYFCLSTKAELNFMEPQKKKEETQTKTCKITPRALNAWNSPHFFDLKSS